jgi:hypothetical protein
LNKTPLGVDVAAGFGVGARVTLAAGVGMGASVGIAGGLVGVAVGRIEAGIGVHARMAIISAAKAIANLRVMGLLLFQSVKMIQR